jgi:protein LTV1
MPRKRWISKNEGQTFRLLYREQNDPLLHDENAGGERALFPVGGPEGSSSSKSPRAEPRPKGLRIADLENDVDFENMRENEGEAAEYGIYFDDTSYDYMQHLREVGVGGATYSIDAAPLKVKGKGKAKTMKLEDALREASLSDEEVPDLVERGTHDGLSAFSTSARERTLEAQQDVPDAIAGFQPNMDPRLREVLEALEDDAYVDDKDEEDVFGALAKEGQMGELDLEEFEATLEDDDEGWESDVTEKAPNQSSPLKQLKMPVGSWLDTFEPSPLAEQVEVPDVAKATAEDGDWLKDFAKYKKEAKNRTAKAPESVGLSSVNAPAPSLYTLNGTPLRQKKRKGALTNPSTYSMTSSSLARTDGQQLLDQRFDQVEKMYRLDEGDEGLDDSMSLTSGLSKQSRISTISTTSFADKGAIREDMESMMDEFLDNWSKSNPTGGKRKQKRGKNGDELRGLQQLDDVRAELGPARLRRAKN